MISGNLRYSLATNDRKCSERRGSFRRCFSIGCQAYQCFPRFRYPWKLDTCRIYPRRPFYNHSRLDANQLRYLPQLHPKNADPPYLHQPKAHHIDTRKRNWHQHPRKHLLLPILHRNLRYCIIPLLHSCWERSCPEKLPSPNRSIRGSIFDISFVRNQY